MVREDLRHVLFTTVGHDVITIQVEQCRHIVDWLEITITRPIWSITLVEDICSVDLGRQFRLS